jgi:hypothetical protein
MRWSGRRKPRCCALDGALDNLAAAAAPDIDDQ